MEQNVMEDIKENLYSWRSLEDRPPYTEIDLLRIIDQWKKDNIEVDQEIEAVLYSMLAFYRLKRNVTDDHLNKHLSSLEGNGIHPMVYEVQALKHYVHLYNYMKDINLSYYPLRETDFDPVKLKKAKALLKELKAFKKQKMRDYSNGGSLKHAYDDIFKQAEELEDITERIVFALERRKSQQEISPYNDQIDMLIRKVELFHHELPYFLREDQTDDPLEELNQMIGLDEVKDYISHYYHYLKYHKKRKEVGFHMVDDQGMNMVITGNPGTGKTTIARLLADIYYRLGLLESNKVIEVNRSHLVGSFMGQSEENTRNYVKQALGGVLFIDEAYNLKREDHTGNDYGQAVIDTLVSSMTSQEYANKFAVIFAGYSEEMNQFLWANQGLRSRFPEGNFIKLPDFTDEELLQIAEETALQNDYFFTKKARNRFRSLIEKARVDESFGNARTVKDLVLKVIFHIGAQQEMPSHENWIKHMRISEADIALLDKGAESSNPMQQLEQLIGLADVKEEVKKLSAFVRVQQKRKAKDLPTVPIQLHSVFSGNPGTGKTTVAQIFAKILKECGLLKRGHLVVASRSDLVAGYVGQTAMKTKSKIREALGGVLFIDEAYALFRGDKDFGKEAIDTLVDEMTKRNENLVVVLAGYKNEMERFISSNPGLESRFKKYFHFQDYTDEELLEMVEFHVQQYQYNITDKVKTYLLDKFNQAQISGNGRFVTNLINEAIQYQALRINGEQDSIDGLQTLEQKDFEMAWNTVRGIERK
ncbi:AAA family ATPase [Gracilibacillus sp. YIM 98692]|uniref:AAA family ATPase n=1 Tax=Gracilibacillus sp. YIM 98692 TaxID=2663532 RepID=UPI0013D74E3E|nr:AAA family ATPase [Gracilibacillus sp. YIM 98692]